MSNLKPLEFTILIEDFNPFLLPDPSVKVGSKEFRESVAKFYKKQFQPVGGTIHVDVDNEVIKVRWLPDEYSQDPFEYALSLLKEGELKDGAALMQSLAELNPDDPDIMFNLGMALSDLGQINDAIGYLSRAVEATPNNVNALVALGVAYQRNGKVEDAINLLKRAVIIEPDNGYAHRNLGAILGNEGKTTESETHLREAVRILPNDQPSLYGLAHCLESSGEEHKIAEADDLYKKTIDINPRSSIAEYARQARSKLAERSFKGKVSGNVRPDAMMYCLSALQKFDKMSRSEVQAVAFEIAMLGMSGLDTNDPTPKYRLRSLPGNYSGLQLVSMMYVGFKRIEPNMDVGFDLSEEYEAAQQLFKAE
ncbi:MAG TPA: tetratricopeptide repeat protein [Pyrinomonadaceae bacterium]|jgi:tetratricopeptide (TPR) repeat protein